MKFKQFNLILIIFENIKQTKAEIEISQMNLASLLNVSSIVEADITEIILSTTQFIHGPYLSTAFG